MFSSEFQRQPFSGFFCRQGLSNFQLSLAMLCRFCWIGSSLQPCRFEEIAPARLPIFRCLMLFKSAQRGLCVLPPLDNYNYSSRLEGPDVMPNKRVAGPDFVASQTHSVVRKISGVPLTFRNGHACCRGRLFRATARCQLANPLGPWSLRTP